MVVLTGVSSGLTSTSQFRSFSLAEKDRAKRFLGVDVLQTAERSSLVSFTSGGFRVSTDVLELLSEC